MKGYFVTGTDTDCGKTLVTTALLAAANRLGLSTVGLKPVAAGCELTDGQLTNQDARLIRQTMSFPLEYNHVNPIALEAAIAPHIAAERENRKLSLQSLIDGISTGLNLGADLALIEGAGGWLVPLNARENLSDLCTELDLQVILVVGMKLGCINHALLTQQAIQGSGVKIAGWVANRIDPNMSCFDENLAMLKSKISGKFLGTLPWITEKNPEKLINNASEYLCLP